MMRILVAAVSVIAATFIVSAPLPAAARFNVLLVIMDTTRADHVPGFGGASARAPWLASLRAARFTNTRSQAPTTTSAVASIFTGLYPSEHGVIDGGAPMPPQVRTLAQLLGEAGYLTGHVTGNPNSGPLYGLTRGFSSVDYSLPGSGSALLHQQLQHADAIERLAAVFLLRQYRPFFLSLHFNDAHSPYDPAGWRPSALPPGARRVYDTPGSDPSVGVVSRVERDDMLRRYDAEIARVDRALAAVAARLQAAGEWDRTIVVITADHGEEFGDHNGWGHSHTLYPELLRVPLLIRVPGMAPRVVTAPVQHVDIVPTVLALCGIRPPPAMSGVSRVPEISGERGAATPVRIAEKLDAVRAPRLFSVQQDRWTLISGDGGRSPELFDFERDPDARVNLAAAQTAVVRRLQSIIDARPSVAVRRDEAAATPDPDTLRNLRALGYLQGASNRGGANLLEKGAALLTRTLLGGLRPSPGASLLDMSSEVVSEESPRRVRVDVDVAAAAGGNARQRVRLRLAAGSRPTTISDAAVIDRSGARQAVTLFGRRAFRLPAGAVVETDPLIVAPGGAWRVTLDADPLSLVRVSTAEGLCRTTITLNDRPTAPTSFPGTLGLIGWMPDRHEL